MPPLLAMVATTQSCSLSCCCGVPMPLHLAAVLAHTLSPPCPGAARRKSAVAGSWLGGSGVERQEISHSKRIVTSTKGASGREAHRVSAAPSSMACPRKLWAVAINWDLAGMASKTVSSPMRRVLSRSWFGLTSYCRGGKTKLHTPALPVSIAGIYYTAVRASQTMSSREQIAEFVLVIANELLS